MAYGNDGNYESMIIIDNDLEQYPGRYFLSKHPVLYC